MNAEELTAIGVLTERIEGMRREVAGVKEDVAGVRGVQEETLSEVRQLHETAGTAMRLATANADDIERLQKWQSWVRQTLESLGGLEGLVKRFGTVVADVAGLKRQHEDHDLVSEERRRIRTAAIRGVVAGAAVAGSVMTAIGVVAGWI